MELKDLIEKFGNCKFDEIGLVGMYGKRIDGAETIRLVFKDFVVEGVKNDNLVMLKSSDRTKIMLVRDVCEMIEKFRRN